MREFYKSFSKIFVNGLRPSKNVAKNADYLEQLKNLKIGNNGLELKPEIVQPTSETISWPFPQLIKLHKDFLVLNNGEIEIVDKLGTFSFSNGLTWHWADFYDFVVLTNGNEVVYRDPDGSYLPSNLQLFKTCCNFKGQLFVGNLPNTYDETYVAWSNIGEANFNQDQRNESGYAPAGVGEVYKTLPLGESVVVYGADGIAAFAPIGRPTPSFGKKFLANFGIASRDAVGGSGNVHIFVDDKGYLWSLSADLKLQKLGYEEFFSQMIGNQIVVSYDQQSQDFYIADGNKCFLLSNGLSQSSDIPTSLEFYQGNLYGFYISDDDSGLVKITTVPLDFDQRALKKITTIEFDIEQNESFKTAVEWKVNNSKDWKNSSWRRLNQMGNAGVGVQANDFKIKLQGNLTSGFKLSRMSIRFQWSDKRFIRGES